MSPIHLLPVFRFEGICSHGTWPDVAFLLRTSKIPQEKKIRKKKVYLCTSKTRNTVSDFNILGNTILIILAYLLVLILTRIWCSDIGGQNALGKVEIRS